MTKNGSKMHNFDAIFAKFSRRACPQNPLVLLGVYEQNFKDIYANLSRRACPRTPLIWLVVYKQNFKFSMQIMALKRTIFSRFFKIF